MKELWVEKSNAGDLEVLKTPTGKEVPRIVSLHSLHCLSGTCNYLPFRLATHQTTGTEINHHFFSK
jgi:hypothetical protein